MTLVAGVTEGRWTLLEEAPVHWWVCRCTCGTIRTLRASELRAGKTKSCGCLRPKTNAALRTHGQSTTKLYKVWNAMRRRCTDENDPAYKFYGGRGITVAPTWAVSFEAFYADVGPPPFQGASLDRIDNEKGYAPGNVRWATKKEQQRNMRSNHFLTYAGRTLSVSAWSEEKGIKKETLFKRIRLGWPDDKVLGTPVKK